ncbi:MAG: D-alanyl-D-alanine carboxypeptidase [Scytolyngbya sp. HA4215-MV1]|nr:D-alanyl-D-alanine carboxypeptidase [Scytolyngbya sp. HA4215-MV1]
MLELFSSGLVSLWLNMAGVPNALSVGDPSSWQETPWIMLPGLTDPIAQTNLQNYLKLLKAKGLPETSQGVWIQEGATLLSEHQGTTPLPAASLTKIATSLVSLETWGPYHQFETLVGGTGILQGGVLQGDLVIQGGGDPFFVWEEAIALGNALNQLGIKRITGNLVITGKFAMNYETDPAKAGKMLKEGLDSRTWTEEPQYQYQTLPLGTPRPQVEIGGSVQVVTQPPRSQFLLIRHQSLPLAQILKQMNIYSNNAIAEMLAELLGGGKLVAQEAAAAASITPTEIRLVNGSGLGAENRISPRAICAMLMAIQRYLRPYRLTVADLFPVAGKDVGTIEGRKIPENSAVKTGTLSDVSALAGVMPTRDRGLIWFAIVNRGTDLEGLRAGQDVLLQSLSKQWGGSLSPAIALPLNTETQQNNFRLGDPNRLQRLVFKP